MLIVWILDGLVLPSVVITYKSYIKGSHLPWTIMYLTKGLSVNSHSQAKTNQSLTVSGDMEDRENVVELCSSQMTRVIIKK